MIAVIARMALPSTVDNDAGVAAHRALCLLFLFLLLHNLFQKGVEFVVKALIVDELQQQSKLSGFIPPLAVHEHSQNNFGVFHVV
jgi:hypothetical protein